MAEVVNVVAEGYQQPLPGSAGIESQVPGAPTTVSAAAGATGGIAPGSLVEVDIDDQLYHFKSDDTPLMQIMLKAKKVKVSSPIVQHYMIDEPRSSVQGTQEVIASDQPQFILSLSNNDGQIPRPHDTLLAKNVDGWAPDGVTRTPGHDLMLFVTGHDMTTGNPICRAVNGPRQSPAAEFCTTPNIPGGTTFILMGNALYETQKIVDPNLIVPQPTEIFCQKRGCNQIISDYFESQKKRIPYTKAIIAEAIITQFKVSGNRTLYAGTKGKIQVQTPQVGVQDIYFTEGIRYQVKKELQHVGRWTIEEFIALSKMIFTGEDIPKTVICLAGKNFLENIQCIDYSKHPEIDMVTKTNKFGWAVTSCHTVFGDIEFKHDPTLDRLKWSNSAFIIAPDRLVHYQYKQEHKASDRIEGEEATRDSMLVWDALALKGSCHIFVNGESAEIDSTINTDATHYHFWGDATAPADPQDGCVYVLLTDCPEINATAVAGTMWQYKGSAWVEFAGDIMSLTQG